MRLSWVLPLPTLPWQNYYGNYYGSYYSCYYHAAKPKLVNG